MLQFQIDDFEIEESIKEKYGENTEYLIQDFIHFLKQKRIQSDVSVSIEQLNNNEGIKISAVMEELRGKYE